MALNLISFSLVQAGKRLGLPIWEANKREMISWKKIDFQEFANFKVVEWFQ